MLWVLKTCVKMDGKGIFTILRSFFLSLHRMLFWSFDLPSVSGARTVGLSENQVTSCAIFLKKLFCLLAWQCKSNCQLQAKGYLWLTLCIQMDFSTQTDTIRMGFSIVYFKWSEVGVSKLCFYIPWRLCLSQQTVQTLMKCHILQHFSVCHRMSGYTLSRSTRIIIWTNFLRPISLMLHTNTQADQPFIIYL